MFSIAAVCYRRFRQGRRGALGGALAAALVLSGCEAIFGGGDRDEDHLLWKVASVSGYGGRPAAEAGRVYVFADSGLAAFDAATGRMLWHPRLRGGGNSANIVERDGALYSAEVEVVRSYDAATGAIRWEQRPSRSADYAESAVDDRAMYVGTREHRVIALARGDGRVLWEVDAGPGWQHAAAVSGLSVSGDTVYASIRRDLSSNGFDAAAVIVALDRGTGRELWRYQSEGTKSNAVGAPVVAGRLLVTSSEYDNSVFAVDRFTGREVWRTLGRRGFVGPIESPHVVDGVIYIGMGDTYVYAMDLATGTVKWSTKTASSVVGIGVCGERVIVDNFDIEVIDRRSGKHLDVALLSDQSDFATSGVAVSGGRAFVAGTRHLYAVRCD
jgi:outer membrane protein assembly factor BamB